MDYRHQYSAPARIACRKAAVGFLLSISIAIFLFGCAKRGKNITANTSGRRVGPCDAQGYYVAYVWRPAQLMSRQGHLVLLDMSTGTETELEPDLNGPMAMADGRVIWWNGLGRDDEGKSDIIVYDAGTGQKSTIAHVKLEEIVADGAQVIWDEASENGSNLVLYDFDTGQQRIISRPPAERSFITQNNISFDDGTVAWEVQSPNFKSRIEVLEVATGNFCIIKIPEEHTPMSVSGNHVVYVPKKGEIHLYEVSSRTEHIIATVERLAGPASIEGNKIAWCEHVTKKRFKGIPGQSLFNEKDICDVFLYDINSGKKKLVAEYLLSNGRATLNNGRIYLSVYREYPLPGTSNLLVPLDLRAW
jgi:hypothetical protein